MPKPPKELIKQIENIENVISSLNDIVDVNKIKMEYYGKDFQEPLTEIRQKALELRDSLEIFKGNLEYSLTAQYTTNERFASTKRVVDTYLSKKQE